MFQRLFLIVTVALALALSVEAFAPLAAIKPAVTSTSLFSCRTNAKKEKRQRNRENMRKFSSGPGKRGMTRRKTLKKAQSSKARQEENEFITKCFITGPAPNEGAEE